MRTCGTDPSRPTFGHDIPYQISSTAVCNRAAKCGAIGKSGFRKRPLEGSHPPRGADAMRAHRQGGRLHRRLSGPQDGRMTRLPKMMLDELEVARKPTQLKSREQFEV
jgi:hypothetical protein